MADKKKKVTNLKEVEVRAKRPLILPKNENKAPEFNMGLDVNAQPLEMAPSAPGPTETGNPYGGILWHPTRNVSSTPGPSVSEHDYSEGMPSPQTYDGTIWHPTRSVSPTPGPNAPSHDYNEGAPEKPQYDGTLWHPTRAVSAAPPSSPEHNYEELPSATNKGQAASAQPILWHPTTRVSSTSGPEVPDHDYKGGVPVRPVYDGTLWHPTRNVSATSGPERPEQDYKEGETPITSRVSANGGPDKPEYYYMEGVSRQSTQGLTTPVSSSHGPVYPAHDYTEGILVPKEAKAPKFEYDPNSSELGFNNALTKYIENLPIKTKEELEKEERRERIAAGIRALGGMATAFSNLAFTGQGAPSQTLAKFDDGEARIDKWRARNDKLWNDYLGAQKLREQLMSQRIADARYEREWQNKLEQQAENKQWRQDNLNMQQKNLDFRAKQAEEERDRWQKTFGANQEDRKAGRALQAAGLRQQGATLAENRRHNEAMEKIYGDRVNVQRYRAGIQNGTMSSINTWNPITGAKEPMVIDWTRAADMMPQLAQEAAQAAETSSSQTLKNAYRDYRSAMMSAKGDAKKIDAANRRLIDTYLSSDSAAASSVVPVLMRAGAIEYDMSDNTMPGVGGSDLGNTIPGLK